MLNLVINDKDVMNIMHVKTSKGIKRWLNEIMNRVKDGKLKNDRDDLIYWMTGITDGWIEY